MELYDVVELVEAVPDQQLPAGAVGTIVDVFHTPKLGYEVEFPTMMGEQSVWSP